MDIERMMKQIALMQMVKLIGGAVGHVDLLEQNAAKLRELHRLSTERMEEKSEGWDNPMIQAMHKALVALQPVLAAAEVAWPVILESEKTLIAANEALAASGNHGPHGPHCICPPDLGGDDVVEGLVEDDLDPQ